MRSDTRTLHEIPIITAQATSRINHIQQVYLLIGGELSLFPARVNVSLLDSSTGSSTVAACPGISCVEKRFRSN